MEDNFDTNSYLNMELLRFTTAGSVDDGKSTLIGRLLYDSKSIFEDQVTQIEEASTKKGLDHVDLSLFTDGLKDEREQGITIDVAYRYFATPKRKFIIADTPGHVQYTRNMVTGASTANLPSSLWMHVKGSLSKPNATPSLLPFCKSHTSSCVLTRWTSLTTVKRPMTK
jgi:sulfate adenylyltransferase subunit 1 (EFTu-like GTPase family)